MAYYSRDEQESVYVYDPTVNRWRVYSTYPPDIKTLLAKAEVTSKGMDSDGKVIAVDGYLTRSQIRIYG